MTQKEIDKLILGINSGWTGCIEGGHRLLYNKEGYKQYEVKTVDNRYKDLWNILGVSCGRCLELINVRDVYQIKLRSMVISESEFLNIIESDGELPEKYRCLSIFKIVDNYTNYISSILSRKIGEEFDWIDSLVRIECISPSYKGHIQSNLYRYGKVVVDLGIIVRDRNTYTPYIKFSDFMSVLGFDDSTKCHHSNVRNLIDKVLIEVCSRSDLGLEIEILEKIKEKLK